MPKRNDAILCLLKSVRQAKGVSQSQLADWVGVKRQAIYDIESGRYLPNTALALRLAKHLGCRVEDLFVDQLTEPEQPIQLVDGTVDRGRRVVVSKLRGRLLAYPLTGEHSLRDGFRPADGLLDSEGSRVRLLCTEEAIEKTVVLMGCDPAFSILGEHVSRRSPEARVHHRFASSHRAVEGLRNGKAHLAGTHLHNPPDGEANVDLVRRLFHGSRALIVGFSVLEEGLMVAHGNPLGIRGAADLAGGRLRLANREPGAALRVLLDDHLKRSGVAVSTVRGYGHEVSSHLEGARSVVHGLADAALGLRAVADACGLDFVPIETVRCDLVVPCDLIDHPSIKVLLDTLQTRLFHEELASIPGYGASRTGDVIART
ncbi:MAG: substrate-binding domain-containing protein [Desulfobacterales bacterium]